MDYRALRQAYGNRLRLIGGIDLDALTRGPPAIRREILNIQHSREGHRRSRIGELEEDTVAAVEGFEGGVIIVPAAEPASAEEDADGLQGVEEMGGLDALGGGVAEDEDGRCGVGHRPGEVEGGDRRKAGDV